jgi:hypothetical protein
VMRNVDQDLVLVPLAMAEDWGQGLTLLHFSAQPKPFGHTSPCPPVY